MNKLVLLIVFCLPVLVNAAGSENSGLSFLKIGIDARAAAMGEAYTAVCSDAAATYWNPAGLARAGSNSIVLMHNSWLQDINHEFLAIQLFRGKHNLAIAVNLIQVTGIQLRGERATENPIGTSSAINMYLGLNYATPLGQEWSVGGQVKYLYEKYYLTPADGIALDLGLRKRGILPDLEWGLSIQNIGTMNKLRSTATSLPLILRTGVGYILPVKITADKPLTALDLYFTSHKQVQLNWGTDIPVSAGISLRGGYALGADSHGFAAGFGLQYWKINIAYAFVPYRYDLGDSHRFSFVVYF
jgi:hypothetical protein